MVDRRTLSPRPSCERQPACRTKALRPHLFPIRHVVVFNYCCVSLALSRVIFAALAEISHRLLEPEPRRQSVELYAKYYRFENYLTSYEGKQRLVSKDIDDIQRSLERPDQPTRSLYAASLSRLSF